MAPVEHDVLGLDVAVDHPVLVGVLQRVGHFLGDPHRVVNRELLLPAEAVAEGFSLDEGHHVEDGALHLAGIEQRQDMRVLQIGRRLDLGQEPLGADHRGEFRPQHLERDLAVVLQVLGEVDSGHAAVAKLPLDGVAVGEGGAQALSRVHRANLSCLNNAMNRGSDLSGS